jgi:xylulose-5-phosphate/fructose-6-phosphate phosphoketolase
MDSYRLQNNLTEHKHYANKHGKDMPEILNRKWNIKIPEK